MRDFKRILERRAAKRERRETLRIVALVVVLALSTGIQI